MATRKQRRRREKTFRHEYGFVVNDEEGNEVELAGSELRARKDASADKTKAAPAKGKPAAKGTPARRGSRDPDPPSWHRSLRRGLIWSPLMILLSYIVFRSTAVPVRIGIGVVYAALFIPMSYWIDGVVYRRSEKRKLAGSSRPQKTR
jgi:hypothetical protein